MGIPCDIIGYIGVSNQDSREIQLSSQIVANSAVRTDLVFHNNLLINNRCISNDDEIDAELARLLFQIFPRESQRELVCSLLDTGITQDLLCQILCKAQF